MPPLKTAICRDGSQSESGWSRSKSSNDAVKALHGCDMRVNLMD